MRGICLSTLTLLACSGLGCAPDPIPTAPAIEVDIGQETIVEQPAASQSPAPLEWVTHRAEALAFSVEMPGPIEQESLRVGQMEFSIVTSQVGPPAQWRCGVARLLADRPDVTDTEMIDAGVEGELRETGGLLHGTARTISVDGNLGREFTVAIPTGGFARQQFIVARPRLFHLRVEGSEAAIAGKHVERFFQSLTILPLKPASAAGASPQDGDTSQD